MKIIRINLLLAFFLLLSAQQVFTQSNRSVLNDGVDKYEQKKYTDAEVDFRKVVDASPKNFEANFNLGTSYYKQQKYDEAVKAFTSSFEGAKDNESKAKVFHNIGNSLLKNKKIEESIEAYKNALKLNPNDNDTKYNLSYALELLKNKDKNDKNDKNKDDQKKDDQKQQDQNKDQQNKDQNKNDQQNPQPKNEEAKRDNTKQPQQSKENKISKQQAEQILEALKNNEKDLQKKIRKKVGKVKQTDKDW